MDLKVKLTEMIMLFWFCEAVKFQTEASETFLLNPGITFTSD